MLKKFNTLLNVIIGSFVGVWIGYSLYTYWDYRTHPDIYAMTSFPWYTGIQLSGIVVAVVVIVSIILKRIIRKKIK